MRRYYVNAHGKPILWPLPEDCLWLPGRLESAAVKIESCSEFAREARLLGEALAAAGVSVEEGGAVVRLKKVAGSTALEEAYRFSVDADGVRIEAATPRGAFYGAMTLLMMTRHAFDPSLAFVKIEDRPAKPFRGVRLPFPTSKDLPWFKSFIDLLGRYKVNRLLLDIGDARAFLAGLRAGDGWREEVRGLVAALTLRHIEALPMVRLEQDNGTELEEIAVLFGARHVCVVLDRPDDGPAMTAAQALAQRASALHARLMKAGAALALESTLLHPATGGRSLRYNAGTGRNEVLPSTCEATDDLPRGILILDTNDGEAGNGPQTYFTSRGFKTAQGGLSGASVGWQERVADSDVLGGYVTLGRAGRGALGEGGDMLAAILRLSCLLWWGYRPDGTERGVLLPLPLEKDLAQLLPMERDALEGHHYPSAENPGYQAIDLRKFYNSPLMHSYWRVDDHFMMYLQETSTLPNAIPFSILEGVLDFRFDMAFVMAGGSWNDGILDIPVGRKAQSLAFLHACIFGKQQYIAGMDTFTGQPAGRYLVHYADGTTEEQELVYGRDICFWKNFHGRNQGAYEANPALLGISEEGLHYTVYAREWVNPRPDDEIVSVDVLPSKDHDGRIALFGITAVGRAEA